ncbi:MAG: CoA-acylating methylmalonate-semialdehyde dehydrogenase [Actinomycetota bacterium]|nr:CoA-acylating methylmalonate-semialdehyde dehydrogenase [Actinomycetota bacterium]
MVGHWIGGSLRQKSSPRTTEVYDPARGRVARRVGLADPEIVKQAVAVALEAYENWREVSLARRTRILFDFREQLVSHTDDLSRLITSEHGKVLDDARGEVARGLEVVDFACGIPHLLKGEFSENVSSAVDSYSIRQPLGVVAGITPFNFPVMVPLWMFPLAIACGNAFVLKPSEKAPSAPNLMAELARRAGVPDGVLNVVHGDKVAVDELVKHPDVAAVSSVGSTPVARHIYKTAAQAGKRVQALGGAKNHMVVLEDADMELTADAVVGSSYGSAGERCMAISAVVAVGSAGDELVTRVADRIKSLRVGPGLDDDVDMGPLVTAEHRDRVVRFVDAGIDEGAELVVDGRVGAERGEGFFLGPSLFDRVETSMSIYEEEIFGPVLCILRAASLDVALELVNSNPYGNGTAIFTASGDAARRYQRDVEVGMVGINVPIPVPMSFFSFGGWKNSLFGDAHVHGMDGVRFYTRVKAVTSRWPRTADGSQLRFPTN